MLFRSLGLEYGADDYMTKPFNILEVKARIKTILRRTGGAKETPKLVLESRGLEINLGSRSVTVRGVPANLTVKEFDLLQLFMNNPGKVYSREDLLDRVWGVDYVGDFRTVDVHIRRLREKIESDPANPEYIMTKWGVGTTLRKRGFFGSIRSRMVAIHMGVTLFAMLIVSVIVINILSNSMLAERVDKQLGETERISFEIAPKLAEEDIDAVFAFIKAKSEALGVRILVLDNYATVTVDSASAYNGYFLAYNEVRAVIAGGRDSYYGFHRVETSASSRRIDDMEWVAYYTAPIIDGGVHIGAVLFASSIQDVSDSINEVVARIALVFVVMTAITAIATFILSSFISKPIVTLTGAIRRMSTNDFTSRVPENGKGEIGELSRAFNRMSEQIQDHERVRNEFVSDRKSVV